MSTDINTIYTWFEEGDFPTATQFQATFSSFYHKNESIPMHKVDGLNAVFNKFILKDTFNSHLTDDKAHAESLLKLDASNITEEYRESLREALGVGDIPSNLATTQYVDQNAKNVANSPLTSTQGAGITMGYKWFIDAKNKDLLLLNLKNATGDDLFYKKIMINNDGALGVKPDEPEFQITIPDTLPNPTAPSGGTMTINHIGNYTAPATIDTQIQALNDFIMTIKDKDFTDLQSSDWNYISTDLGTCTGANNTGILLKKTTNDASVQSTQQLIASAYPNLTLPRDKNWVFSIGASIGHRDARFNTGVIGITQSSANTNVGVLNGFLSSVSTGGDTASALINRIVYAANGQKDIATGGNTLTTFVKVGNILAIIVKADGIVEERHIDITGIATMKPLVSLFVGQTNLNENIIQADFGRYWIEP